MPTDPLDDPALIAAHRAFAAWADEQARIAAYCEAFVDGVIADFWARGHVPPTWPDDEEDDDAGWWPNP